MEEAFDPTELVSPAGRPSSPISRPTAPTPLGPSPGAAPTDRRGCAATAALPPPPADAGGSGGRGATRSSAGGASLLRPSEGRGGAGLPPLSRVSQLRVEVRPAT